jgi:GrpB-like predicted nucleotidyltransferase (UPF0157 family)
MSVTLVERYNPEWPQWFLELKSRFETTLTGQVLRIEHVGSTSVPGMTAKPIIAIDIVYEDGQFDQIRARLEELGYFHQGNIGITDRDAFDISDLDIKAKLKAHHPYACPESSEELRRHLDFRDFLRRSPEHVEQLSNLKWKLAMEFDNDRQAYMDGKVELCKEILQKARMIT